MFLFLSNWLESSLRIFSPANWTECFLWILLFSLVVLLISFRKGRLPTLTTHAPALLASLGILGTFVGIVVGLLDFNPQQLDKSIEGLLEGLKTAFVSSIAGIAAGLFFRIATTFLLAKSPDEAEAEIGPEEILEILKEQKDLLQATKEAIAGSEESSLSGQIKLLRTDLSDRNREDIRFRERFEAELWQRLQTFAEMLSKSATEQVIKALEAVIVDFNRNLTEQFGENFKRLDASVQKLVEWQEGYRRLLAELHSLYDQSVQKITTIENSVTQIAEQSATIPNSMQHLTGIMETVQFQIEELERHLSAFKELRDHAVEAIPQTQAHVEAMTRDIAEAVRVAGDNLSTLQRDSKEQLDSLARAGQSVQDGILVAQDLVTESLKGMQARVENVQKETLDRQLQATETMVRTMLDGTEKAVGRTGEGINKQIESLDEAVSREMNRIMQQMANGLGQIAGQFITDYKRFKEQIGNADGRQ
ncbi:MAG: MotA/TolQ/ExbB proton channel family protein [Gemmatimonadota bacterium]|nr:MotA/TolQ/ExbB proton channel family protein [Gemmatimonadota bacterium]